MKAAIYDRYGPPEVLRVADVPAPQAAPGEVLIRVRASVVTPSDLAARSAKPFIIRFFSGLFAPKDKILGTTLAGEVAAVAPGVTDFAPGDRVYAATYSGGYAEYVTVGNADAMARLPAGTTFGEAAGLAEGYLTAMPFLRDEAKLQAGQRILINGASGNVGTIALQLAKTMGAHVTAVCSARNAELVRRLGADDVIDHGAEDFTRRHDAWDVIFDAVGKSSFGRCRAALKRGGVYMTTVPAVSIILPMLRGRDGQGKRGLLATTGLRKAADKVRDLELLAGVIERNEVKVVVDRSYALDEIVEAHRYVATQRKRGSVVLAITADGQ